MFQVQAAATGSLLERWWPTTSGRLEANLAHRDGMGTLESWTGWPDVI
jgi:hypothetical protein